LIAHQFIAVMDDQWWVVNNPHLAISIRRHLGEHLEVIAMEGALDPPLNSFLMAPVSPAMMSVALICVYQTARLVISANCAIRSQ